MSQRGNTWSDEETFILISIWREDYIQTQLDSVRNKPVFEKVASEMRVKGFDRTYQQCRDKIKKLKKEYSDIVDNNNISGRGRKEWRFFEQIHEILGTRPTTKPKNIVASNQNIKRVNDKFADDLEIGEGSGENRKDRSFYEGIDEEHDAEENEETRVILNDENVKPMSTTGSKASETTNAPGKPQRKRKNRRTDDEFSSFLEKSLRAMEGQEKVLTNFLKFEEERWKREEGMEQKIISEEEKRDNKFMDILTSLFSGPNIQTSSSGSISDVPTQASAINLSPQSRRYDKSPIMPAVQQLFRSTETEPNQRSVKDPLGKLPKHPWLTSQKNP